MRVQLIRYYCEICSAEIAKDEARILHATDLIPHPRHPIHSESGKDLCVPCGKRFHELFVKLVADTPKVIPLKKNDLP